MTTPRRPFTPAGTPRPGAPAPSAPPARPAAASPARPAATPPSRPTAAPAARPGSAASRLASTATRPGATTARPTATATRPAATATATPAPAARPASGRGSAPGEDYHRFCAGIKSATGIDLGQYRPGQMERRLRSFAQRQGFPDLDAYLAMLKRDGAALDEFLDRMTINVSELFRNPERFVDVERTVFPELLGRSGGNLKVWSAGCSYGAEIYSLSVLLREVAPRGRHELLAADIDQRILARAREGVFSPSDMRNVTPERRQRWFTESTGPSGPQWQVSQELRSAVQFRQMDLLKDTFPGGFDFIACRNVVIYFNDDAKDVLYRRFFDALKPGGILFVGSTERINNSEAMGWQKSGTFFYQRPL